MTTECRRELCEAEATREFVNDEGWFTYACPCHAEELLREERDEGWVELPARI